MNKQKNGDAIYMRLSAKLKKLLRGDADREGRTISGMARRIIEKHYEASRDQA